MTTNTQLNIPKGDGNTAHFLNGAGVYTTPAGSATGTLIGVQVFTGSGTYTPTSGMVTYIAEACGGGGGSGGAKTAVSSLGATGGGGAGGYLKMKGTASDIGASKTVTIGAGGTAGVGATPTNGGNGAATTLGTLWSCGGGVGSVGVTVGTITAINAGGVGGTNTVTTGTTLANIAGGAGSPGQTVTNVSIGFCGRGGNSQFGQGGITQTDNVAAIQGTGYGSGASGAMSNGNDKNGAVGQDGYMIIYEYN
jgi:hypothetical protein